MARVAEMNQRRRGEGDEIMNEGKGKEMITSTVSSEWVVECVLTSITN